MFTYNSIDYIIYKNIKKIFFFKSRVSLQKGQQGQRPKYSRRSQAGNMNRAGATKLVTGPI